VNEMFRKLAQTSALTMGSPWAFSAALLVVLIWGALGPAYHFSDTWQLVINTGTTIVTFLMVFVIQNSQNRDGHAIQLKLDELIRAVKGARNRLIDLENCSDEELQRLHQEFERLSKRIQPAAVKQES
jgi:low affinity Fe/Cu permease